MTAHESATHQHEIKTSSDRSFGFVFAAIFLVIGLLPLFKSGGVLVWSLIVSGLFAAPAAVKPSVLAPLNRGWTAFGLWLNKIVSPVVMGVLFFLVVTPMGIFMRMAGKDLLRLKLQPSAKSYWIPREPPGPDPETMSNQF